VFGRAELEKLAREKQALVAESELNRLLLRAELQHLRAATAWVSEAARWPQKTGPLLLLLAPLAGFVLARLPRRSDSWLSRVSAAAKWIGPLYSLWKGFAASRTKAEAGEPAA
jgi:hypothetical protein